MSKIFLLLAFVVLVPATLFSQMKELADGKMSFTSNAAPWELVLGLKGYSLLQSKTRPDGSGIYFLLKNEGSGMNVSLFIEPAEKCKTSKECRDMVLNAGNPGWGEYQDLVQSEIGDVSFFEFYRPEAHGAPLKMFDMYAQFVQDGFWVDLHISKVLYKKADHKLFEDVVKSAQFIKKTSAQAKN
jgi:hypothetical protein